MTNKILSFEADISGDMLSDGSRPIYDDNGDVVGGFTLKRGSTVSGFVAFQEWHKLYVAHGTKFFFTPTEGQDGKINGGLVTEVKISALSIEIQPEELTNER